MKTRAIQSLRVAIIAFVTVMAIHLTSPSSNHLWMVASMGAAMVIFCSNKGCSLFDLLVFNITAALLGVSIGLLFPLDAQPIATGCALAVIIFIMNIFGRMHPPAGATAVLATLVSHDIGYKFILTPLLPNLVVMSIALSLLRKKSKKDYKGTISPS